MSSIGDEGIQILSTVKMPNLLLLHISHAGISAEGMQALSKLQTPFLKILNLAENQYTERELTAWLLDFQY